MADVQEMTPKQFADGFYARLKDKDSKFSPFRKFTVDLMKQYPQGIPDDVLAQRASKELPVFAGVKINAGGQASDQQVKQDADKINSTVGTALTKPLVDYAHASEGVENVKETARGWQQGVPAGGEHTLGQLGTTVGQVTTGVLTGLTEAGIQMTSPSNLALLAASFGLNKIKQGAKLIPIIKAMAAGTFSAEMLKDLATEIPEAKKYLEHGDAVGFGNAVGRGLADLTIGVKTGKEAYKGSKAAITNGAPNVEAPPAARTEATPEEQISKAGSTEDVRTIPKEHLRAAYETAVQQNAELRPRLERAQTGAREARTKLQDYQTKLEELEFSPTPPDAKVVEHVKKTIATQKQHVESLEQRSREIGDDYKKWQRTLLEARDRAVHRSAKPPSFRHVSHHWIENQGRFQKLSSPVRRRFPESQTWRSGNAHGLDKYFPGGTV